MQLMTQATNYLVANSQKLTGTALSLLKIINDNIRQEAIEVKSEEADSSRNVIREKNLRGTYETRSEGNCRGDN
jgi:hypothetical protein